MVRRTIPLKSSSNTILKLFVTIIRKKGQPAARNLCCRKAQGEFFAWLDADDYYLPGKLTAQMNYLTEHPECEIVFTRFKNFYENEEEWTIRTENGIVFSDEAVSHATMLASRSLVEKVGERDESLFVADDVEWLDRMALLYDVDISHCIGCIYMMKRLHLSSNSFKNTSSETLNFLLKQRASYCRKRLA